LAIYREKDFAERRNAASDAKQALLAKFKSRPNADDPSVLARQAERKAILEARAIREAEEEARLKAEAEAAELARIKAAEEEEMLSAKMALEAAQKAKRDARYAARKARGGRLPPGFKA
jgi:hypothetical protein